MGYTLKIGEAVLDWSEDYVHIDVEDVRLDEAPAFNEPTDYTNSRWPSYTSWANAMEALGLVDLMFNRRNGGRGCIEWNGVTREPLITEHPGAQPISKEHLAYAEAKVSEYRSKHPSHIAQFPPPREGAKPLTGNIYADEDLVKDPRYDGHLCRAEWLLFWMRWALANCKQPVFYNS